MKPLLKYSFLLRQVILLILVGQIWATTVNFCQWMIDSDWELIELNSSEENESEKENQKKYQEDKNQPRLSSHLYNHKLLVQFNFRFKNFSSLHHHEVDTPPPESFRLFS